MTTKRRHYTQEFKDSAVKLVIEQGYSLAEASRNLDVNTTQLRRWKRAEEESRQPDITGMTPADFREAFTYPIDFLPAG